MVNISKLWVNIRQQFCLQSYDHGTLKIIMLQDYKIWVQKSLRRSELFEII